ncbi:MAG TPA: hypothetical protein VFA19_10255 [Gaiellaceae bacterium]|nr:hypothetical protein [Gaiellaceae bacterium]
MLAGMKRRPEEIIGEWGVRDVTPPSQLERRRVEADRDLNPLLGRPLRRRLRNFRPEADTYLASLGGPLPYMRRLRQIEEEIDQHLARLAEAYEAHRADPAAWRALAERWDFGAVNELIAKHNRWYPVESRLPMDPRTRDFVHVGGRPYRLEPLDAAWILERFPA